MKIDYKISTIQRPDNGDVTVKVRFYEGDMEDKNGKQVYVRQTMFEEKVLTFTSDSSDEEIRKQLNKMLFEIGKEKNYDPIDQQK